LAAKGNISIISLLISENSLEINIQQLPIGTHIIRILNLKRKDMLKIFKLQTKMDYIKKAAWSYTELRSLDEFKISF